MSRFDQVHIISKYLIDLESLQLTTKHCDRFGAKNRGTDSPKVRSVELLIPFLLRRSKLFCGAIVAPSLIRIPVQVHAALSGPVKLIFLAGAAVIPMPL